MEDPLRPSEDHPVRRHRGAQAGLPCAVVQYGRSARHALPERNSFQFGKVYSRVRDADLLLFDDLAYMPYAEEKVEFLFSLVVDRHELGRGSTIVTSNTDVTEWWQYFPSKAMGMAFSDRLLDRAQGIRFAGESIRQSRSRQIPQQEEAQASTGQAVQEHGSILTGNDTLLP